jgi:UDP-GlcNAc:undecaprenyl-phosphate GlcNAc-1-phosphate transferase
MNHLSHKNSWYDHINERKIHTGDIPRLGGIGFAGVYIIVAVGIAFLPGEPSFPRFFFPLVAMFLIFAVGIFDDFRPLPPRYKLSIQIVAGLLIVIPDFTFRHLFFFDISLLGELNWLRYPLSLLWIVGLSNAINFIDGVDGLAGGISALAVLSYALIFGCFFNNGSIVLLCFCLVAVLGGFLVFNLPLPSAKIFMGDGGSQFLGFMLAFLPLIDTKNTVSLPLPYAAVLLSIPIFDTFAAIWRRLRDHRRIDSPDRFHIHHKLMNFGLDALGVDCVLYSLQIVLGILVFLSVQQAGRALSLVFLGAAYVVSVGFFAAIHFMSQRLTVPEDRKPGP